MWNRSRWSARLVISESKMKKKENRFAFALNHRKITRNQGQAFGFQCSRAIPCCVIMPRLRTAIIVCYILFSKSFKKECGNRVHTHTKTMHSRLGAAYYVICSEKCLSWTGTTFTRAHLTRSFFFINTKCFITYRYNNNTRLAIESDLIFCIQKKV